MYLLPAAVEFDGRSFDYSPDVNPALPILLWMASAANRGDASAHRAIVIMLGQDGVIRDRDGADYWSAGGAKDRPASGGAGGVHDSR